MPRVDGLEFVGDGLARLGHEMDFGFGFRLWRFGLVGEIRDWCGSGHHLVFQRGEDPVSSVSGFPDVPCAQRAPDASGGEVGQVDGAVQPPGAVVVPEVVVRVVRGDANGQSCRCHDALFPFLRFLVQRTRRRKKENRPSRGNQDGRFQIPAGEFVRPGCRPRPHIVTAIFV